MADELSKGDDIVEEFLEEASILVSDYDLKESYDHFLDMKKAGYQSGLEHGIERGIEQGKRENSIETAKRLFALDLNINDIRKATELPIEVINDIKKSLNIGK